MANVTQSHAITLTGLNVIMPTGGVWYTLGAFPHFVDTQITQIVFTFFNDDWGGFDNYTDIKIQWRIFQPQSTRENLSVIATGEVENMYASVPMSDTVASGQIKYQRPVLFAMQTIKGKATSLRKCVVTIQTRQA